MRDNDSTYQGNVKESDLWFNSPLVIEQNNLDEFDFTWVRLSENIEAQLRSWLMRKNKEHNFELPMANDLTSYDNPDYLWLSYELEHLRELYNTAVRNPETGELAPGHGQIPYIQLRLQALAYSKDTRYPKAKLNGYGLEYKPHYVVEFEKTFLDAFMKFIFAMFDDNPQQYIEAPDGRKIIIHQHKAPIYRNKVFGKYFATRHDLPAIIFQKAVQMLLAHEVAHVGLGHLDLQEIDKVFGNDKDTVIVEEQQADVQGICWLLGERFLEMETTTLDIAYEDLFQELSLTVFAIYMLYTWDYSDDNRKWSSETIKQYGKRKHLPYQLRAYKLIETSYNRLLSLGEWAERDRVHSLDGRLLDKTFMQSVFNEAIDMIEAFEATYHMTLVKTKDIWELSLEEDTKELLDKIRIEMDDNIPEIEKEDIPWRLGFELEAQEELVRVNELSQEVITRLRENGTYCKLSDYKPLDIVNPHD